MAAIGLATTETQENVVIVSDGDGKTIENIDVSGYQNTIYHKGESITVNSGGIHEGNFEFGAEYDTSEGHKVVYERVGEDDTIRRTVKDGDTILTSVEFDASDEGWTINPPVIGRPESVVLEQNVSINGNNFQENQRVRLNQLHPEGGSAQYYDKIETTTMSPQQIGIATGVPAAVATGAYALSTLPNEAQNRKIALANQELNRTANMANKLPTRRNVDQISRA